MFSTEKIETEIARLRTLDFEAAKNALFEAWEYRCESTFDPDKLSSDRCVAMLSILDQAYDQYYNSDIEPELSGDAESFFESDDDSDVDTDDLDFYMAGITYSKSEWGESLQLSFYLSGDDQCFYFSIPVKG